MNIIDWIESTRCSDAISKKYKMRSIKQKIIKTDRNEKDFKNHDLVAFCC